MRYHISTIAAAAFALALPASAQEAVLHDFDGSFEDATFAVESAIVGRGLVVDYVSHVGEMLARTGADVGSDVTIFDAADVFLFCSAVVSRSVMEADPMNVIHCPYNVFVLETDGKVQVGYRTYPEGPMQEVQQLLDEIVREAADG
ncbi:DUF302 domain-containing protein [Tropicimonas sediminicola]|uniref:Uncharacterized conserved protein, DUF302 family n=1 Tax=Tropicimonas sediminicola TaxID=1031541 RepID=A0A239F7R4_9RHOB|nr:DUF302 domain-containing protein [Tropicimonas sediminicola]SNS52528.1 Uncharacterized conserved protein, DUF302 family [Tropicimonas sediminicola]